MAFDRFVDFRICQQYQITYTREFDQVRLVLDYYEHVSTEAGPLVLKVEQFKKWFRKG